MERIMCSDRTGKASEMVRVPRFNLADVIPGASSEPHPAFVREGKVLEAIYVSKYQNVIEDGKAYSVKQVDPAVFVTFEQAQQACLNKGGSWHLMTNAEWGAVALWSRKNGSLPHGNNDFGKDSKYPQERGVDSQGAPCPQEGKPFRVLTGSGPHTWSHDHSEAGIYDLNGNIWEYVDGVRLRDGCLELADQAGVWQPMTVAGRQSTDRQVGCRRPAEATSKEAAPHGIYFAAAGEGIRLTDRPPLTEGQQAEEAPPPQADAEPQIVSGSFSSLPEQTTFPAPELLKAHALYPPGEERIDDVIAAKLQGIVYGIRGGYWVNKEMAGAFAIGFLMAAEENYFDVGFRSVCYSLQNEPYCV